MQPFIMEAQDKHENKPEPKPITLAHIEQLREWSKGEKRKPQPVQDVGGDPNKLTDFYQDD